MRLELWISGKKRREIYPEWTHRLAIADEVIRLKRELKEKEYIIYLIVPSKANTE